MLLIGLIGERCWPQISDITIFMDATDRARIRRKLASRGMESDSEGLKKLLFQRIDSMFELEGKKWRENFDFSVIVNSQIGDVK
jgi:hypothetical protein